MIHLLTVLIQCYLVLRIHVFISPKVAQVHVSVISQDDAHLE